MNIRRALPGESEELSALARSAKALWGYSAEQLAAWSEDLRICPKSLADQPTFVAEENNRLVGVVQLACHGTPWRIEHFWVRPEATRRGIGGALLEHAVVYAAQSGHTELHIDSDPGAEAFYLQHGARRVGVVPAPIKGQPDRHRPQLVLSTESSA